MANRWDISQYRGDDACNDPASGGRCKALGPPGVPSGSFPFRSLQGTVWEMSWRSLYTVRWIVVACLLAHCSDPPLAPERRVVPAERPSGPSRNPGGTPSQAALDSLRAWFAGRGVTLPAEIPAEPAGKVAKVAQTTERLLGDGSSDGWVNFWDVWSLFQHLTNGYTFDWYYLDAFDIDRDGDADWIDLGLLGDYLYRDPPPPNTYGIGLPIAPAVTASLDPDPLTVDFVADGTDWKRFVVHGSPGAPR